MGNDVLTTTQAARLLGVSVRTAQLFIEGGSIASWKTPGGHRRVHRADVLAFMERTNHTPAAPSARVVLLASGERLSRYEKLLSGVSGCFVDAHSNAFAAAFAIASRVPAAVVVDLEEETDERLAFLSRLSASPATSQTRLITLAGTGAAAGKQDFGPTHTRVTQPDQLPEVVRTLLGDVEDVTGSLESTPLFPRAANEEQRLIALARSRLADTPPEDSFDRITWLASYTLDAPVALMTVLTATRQWFKSRQGIELSETPRSWAFCNHTILQRDTFIVPDLAADDQFADNPAVAGGPNFRFYAGAPVIDLDGFALASLCVIDYKPRVLNAGQKRVLLSLAALASDELRLRSTNREAAGNAARR